MKTTNTIGVLAAVAALMSSGTVFAAEDQPRREVINYADLDLKTEAGAQRMLKRIRIAARKVCIYPDNSFSATTFRQDCRKEATQNAVQRLGSPMVTEAFSGALQPVRLARR